MTQLDAPVFKKRVDPKRVTLNSDGFAYRTLMVRLPSEVIADDLKEPDLWAKVQISLQALRKLDHVLLISYDESWLAEAIVSHADRTGVTLTKPRITSLAERSISLFTDGTYRVEWNGRDYDVVRIDDQHVMSSGHNNPAIAERALTGLYARSLA